MSKYEPLLKYLAGQSAKRLTLEMQEIEQILGEQLPASAHRHVAWWSNGTTRHHPQCRAWMENGYHTVYKKGDLPFHRQSGIPDQCNGDDQSGNGKERDRSFPANASR